MDTKPFVFIGQSLQHSGQAASESVNPGKSAVGALEDIRFNPTIASDRPAAFKKWNLLGGIIVNDPKI